MKPEFERTERSLRLRIPLCAMECIPLPVSIFRPAKARGQLCSRELPMAKTRFTVRRRTKRNIVDKGRVPSLAPELPADILSYANMTMREI